MNRKLIAILITGSLLVGAGGMYVSLQLFGGFGGSVPFHESGFSHIDAANLEKISQAYDLILGRYVQKVDSGKLTEGAIQGMLSILKDPYSVYMDKNTAQQFTQSLDSSFEGIGAQVGMVNGKIVIVSSFRNSPAEKAGLLPNDQILTVDGKNVEGLNLGQVTSEIRGKRGSIVVLEVARKNVKEPITIAVERDRIPLETVYSSEKDVSGKKMGYMDITSFSENTAPDFKKQLQSLEKDHIKGLIIDVRGNPGGFLSSVEDILKEFVIKDKPMVQIEQRNGQIERFFSSLTKKKAYPVVVLVDKGSASASEILASSLQEADGYKLVGEKTFGKGTVQQAIPMGDGSNIKLTLFKWLTPDGNWIHQKGIQPDVPIQQPAIFQSQPVTVEKILTQDMNDDQVKNAQEILQGLGFVPGRTDGYFSAETVKAVTAFQEQQNLLPTGKIDQKTADKLNEAVMNQKKNPQNDLQLQTALRLLTIE